MFPHVARGLIEHKEGKKPVLIIIGVFLIITAALEFPIAGMLGYYASSDGLDFGGTLTLHGKVVADDGSNLSGVTVTIIGTNLSSISDENGNYTIRNAPNGIWRIKASLTGYNDEIHKVLIHSELEFTDTVNFKLKEGRGRKEFNDIWFFLSLCILMIMFSSFIIAGSYYSFKRRRFSVVLVGAILGIFTMSPPLVLWFIPSIFMMSTLGFILSTSALIMTIMNRKAFTESERTNSQKKEDGVF